MVASARPAAALLEQRLQSVSLRQLRFVAALAQDNNFSRAAARMAVSQPALSAAIRQTEALLDLKLFDRTTHRVALTDAGRAVLPHLTRLLVTADYAFADIADAAMRQQVRIGAIPSAVPAVARQLAATPPDVPEPVETTLCDGKSDDLVARVIGGSLDLAVCVQAGDDPALDAAPLTEDGMLLLVRPDHPLAARADVAWGELAGEEIVHFTGGSIGELVSGAMRQHGLAASRRFTVDQVDSVYGIVRAGLALGVMPRLYTMGLGWDRVALVPLARPRLTRRLVALSRRSLAREFPAGRQFIDDLTVRLRVDLGDGAASPIAPPAPA